MGKPRYPGDLDSNPIKRVGVGYERLTVNIYLPCIYRVEGSSTYNHREVERKTPRKKPGFRPPDDGNTCMFLENQSNLLQCCIRVRLYVCIHIYLHVGSRVGDTPCSEKHFMTVEKQESGRSATHRAFVFSPYSLPIWGNPVLFLITLSILFLLESRVDAGTCF